MGRILSLLTPFSLLIISCSNQGFKAPLIQKGSQEEGSQILFGNVCYESTCLPTISQFSIEDPEKNFTYIDEAEFPNEALRPQYRRPYAFVDLVDKLETKSLSENFQLWELMSLSKGRYGIFSPLVLSFMQALREDLNSPVFVTSAYRSPGYNRGIPGAATWSRHTYGDAVDFFTMDHSLEDLRDLCLKYGASFFQIYTSHIHCDWRTHELDSAFFPPRLSPRSTVSTYQALSNMTEIHSHFDGQNLHFHVHHPPAEDGGTLIYKWLVKTPAGQTLEFDATSIHLLPEIGTYKVSVTVGGSIHSQTEFSWP